MFEDALRRVEGNLGGMWRGLEAPAAVQETLYESLLDDYMETEYCQLHEALPVAGYSDLEPWIERVMEGDSAALLAEEPITWAMTRGTTGESKMIPVTPRHLDHLVRGGSRAVLNHAMAGGGLDLGPSPAAC